MSEILYVTIRIFLYEMEIHNLQYGLTNDLAVSWMNKEGGIIMPSVTSLPFTVNSEGPYIPSLVSIEVF